MAELVAWMVERPETRQALETAMLAGALDVGEHSDQFLAIVDVAVSLSRFEAEATILDPRMLDLRATVEEVHRSLGDTVPGTLALSIDEDVPEGVHADPDQLERVLAALISIATPSRGGTELVVHVERAATDERGSEGAAVLAFEIETAGGLDHGHPGNPLGADRSSLLPKAARGLGVAVCAELVSQMGGELAGEGDPDHEGTFRLTFPRSSAAPGGPG